MLIHGRAVLSPLGRPQGVGVNVLLSSAFLSIRPCSGGDEVGARDPGANAPTPARSGGVSCSGMASDCPLDLGLPLGELLGWAGCLAQTHYPAVCFFLMAQILPGHRICHPLCLGVSVLCSPPSQHCVYRHLTSPHLFSRNQAKSHPYLLSLLSS